MHFVGHVPERLAIKELLLEIGTSCRRGERDIQILMALNLIRHTPGRNLAWPAHHHRDTDAAFPCRTLLATERRIAAVGPEQQLVTVVGRVDNDGIVTDTEVIELLEKRTDILVMLDHLCAVYVLLCPAFIHRHLHVFLLR